MNRERLLDLEGSLLAGLPVGDVDDDSRPLIELMTQVADRTLAPELRELARHSLVLAAPFLALSAARLPPTTLGTSLVGATDELWRLAMREFQDDAEVQANAAAYFRSRDVVAARAASRRLLALDPSWRGFAVCADMELIAADLELDDASYQEAADLADNAVDLIPGPLPVCADAALASFLAGRHERARLLVLMTYDPAMFSVSPARHLACTVNGLLSLNNGDADDAETNLWRAAGEKPGLRGPSFRLANALRASGHPSDVRRYVAEVAGTWSEDRGRTTQWIQQLDRGERVTLLNPGR